MDLAQGNIGAETKYDIAFTGGKLQITANYAGQQAGASVSVSVDSVALLEVLKAKLNGALSTEIINVIELALKA